MRANEAANSRFSSHHAALLLFGTNIYQMFVHDWSIVDQGKQHYVPWPKPTQQPHDNKDSASFLVEVKGSCGYLFGSTQRTTKDKRAVITTIEFIALKAD